MSRVVVEFEVIVTIHITQETIEANQEPTATGATSHIAGDAERGGAGAGIAKGEQPRWTIPQPATIKWRCCRKAKGEECLTVGLVKGPTCTAKEVLREAIAIRTQNSRTIIKCQPTIGEPVAMGPQLTCRPEKAGRASIEVLSAEHPIRKKAIPSAR